MPSTPHLPGDRFFARIRSFDLECPACGTVYVIRPTTVRRTRAQRTDHQAKTGRTGKVWSDVLQRFSCHGCAGIFALGIVAWPVRPGSRLQPAEDSIPSRRQAVALRALTGGWWLKTRSGADDPRNVKVTQPCLCDPDTRFVNPGCTVHGEVRGDLPTTPQKVWKGSLPNKPRKGSAYDDE